MLTCFIKFGKFLHLPFNTLNEPSVTETVKCI